ncbi:MAG: CehA/McbA family metallohydrolase [Clostridiales bacterium]|nr:CehA/McbA family metallohydrolase [Clostridiales bacterium]
MWLKGDTHMHTNVSDGALPPEELLKKAKKRGFDFIMITDHNRHGAGNKSYYYEGMLVIPGEEVTQSKFGHLNIWGSGTPTMDGVRPETSDVYYEAANAAHENGGFVSINHPFDKRFFWDVDLENFPADSYEVWNTVMHGDNMTAISWWHSQLLKGRRLPAVGGSDYHRDYYVTRLLGVPTTYVNAEEKTEESIFKAIREGRVFITNSPNGGRITIEYGDKTIGDTATVNDDTAVVLKISKLRKGMRAEIYNNDRLIYRHKAKTTGEHTASVGHLMPGFVRAQITYDFSAFEKAVYKKIVAKVFPPDAGLPVPTFAYALTNPIWLTSSDEKG